MSFDGHAGASRAQCSPATRPYPGLQRPAHRGKCTADLGDETPALRASDGEREQTVEFLRAHAADGRLTLEEFAERVEVAYAARTRTELDALVGDLPGDASGSPPLDRHRPKRFTGVAFGSVERRGRWRLPRFAALAVIFGDADIDLRTAEFEGGLATIAALLLFGNADFYVPTGADIDLGGLTVFGHRREHGDDSAPATDAPLARIRVYSLFGTSDVWYVPREASGSFGELIKSVRKRGRAAEGRELHE
jgi:hypothetical protein